MAYYPESRVELNGFIARHYDALMDIITFGVYSELMKRATGMMGIEKGDRIADLGAGTGRNACLMIENGAEHVTGFDISDEMISQFEDKCNDKNANVVKKRIDVPIDGYDNEFDKVFISFALHGFPEHARNEIIRNAYRMLREGGKFFILDYNEFSYNNAPLHVKIPFRIIECRYAFEFIELDLKNVLKKHGFGNFEERLLFSNYIRLLGAEKL